MLNDNLIIDVGMHIGNDTAFYLAKGFRVVAVEANPKLVDQARVRLSHEIATGRLTICNSAIVNYDGEIEFYVSDEHPDTGTISKMEADYSRRLG